MKMESKLEHVYPLKIYSTNKKYMEKYTYLYIQENAPSLFNGIKYIAFGVTFKAINFTALLI
jgi:hypothetical protein